MYLANVMKIFLALSKLQTSVFGKVFCAVENFRLGAYGKFCTKYRVFSIRASSKQCILAPKAKASAGQITGLI